MSNSGLTPRQSEILSAFRKQADFCHSRGADFTAAIINTLGSLIEVRDAGLLALLATAEGDPATGALALRMTGAFHALVLKGRGAGLARFYKTPTAIPSRSALVDAMAPLLEAEEPHFKDYIAVAPQTNEIRRGATLLIGFSEIAKAFPQPLDLYEPGASAGLLLQWDKRSYDYGAFRWGKTDFAIQSAWRGKTMPNLVDRINVSGRRGCDLYPRDICDPETCLRMKSYIWPEDYDRLALFERAVKQAKTEQPRIDRMDAVSWVRERLAERASERISVFYTSVFTPYLSTHDRKDLRRAFELAGNAATNSAPLAWLRFEPHELQDRMEFFVDLTVWPGGEERRLARADAHGAWVEPLADL